MSALIEVLPGILSWHWFAQRFGYDFNGLIVDDPGGNLAIDPVEMSDHVLDWLATHGVARIAITNRNHFRAAEKLRARTGAKVAVHADDAAFVRAQGVTVDDALVVGEKIGPFAIVDASGKSPGEVALHWPERGILVVGDICVGKTPASLGLLPDKVIDDKARLIASLRRLVALDFKALLCGDGASFRRDGHAVLESLVASL